MEVVVTSAVIRRAKLQSNHHHQQTNIPLFTGQMLLPFPNQHCQSAGALPKLKVITSCQLENL